MSKPSSSDAPAARSLSRKLKEVLSLEPEASFLPIRILYGLGILTASAGVLYAFGTLRSGGSPLMAATLIFDGAVLAALGLVGEHLRRIHAVLKGRPAPSAGELPAAALAPVASAALRPSAVAAARVEKTAPLAPPEPFPARPPAAEPALADAPVPEPAREPLSVPWKGSMTMPEAGAVLGLAALGVGLLAYFYAKTALIRQLDTVFLFESVRSILEGGVPFSTSVETWPEIYKTFSMKASEVCALPFGFPEGAGFNVLKTHGYFLLYPIALVAKLIGVEESFALLNASAHVALVLLPYLFLRGRGLSPLAAAMFPVCVLLYPAWSLSAVGDYYVDRFYPALFLVLLYALDALVREGASRGAGRWLLCALAAAVAAAATTERAAILAVGTLVYFLAFFPSLRRDRRTLLGLAAFPVLAACYLAWYMGSYQEAFFGGTVSKLQLSPGVLFQRIFAPGFLPFLLTNLLFIGWMAFFSGWRYGLLAIGATAPNILITIGGAELNGWATHYHAGYLGFLVFAASVGYSNLAVRFRGRVASVAVPVLACGWALLSSWGLDPTSGGWKGREVVSSGILRNSYDYFVRPERSGEKAVAYWMDILRKDFPPNVKVSATAGTMPALYDSRRMTFYPAGMDGADYLVVSGTAKDGKVVSASSAVSYLGPAEAAELNACLMKRAAKQGFILQRDIPPVGLLVFKRAS